MSVGNIKNRFSALQFGFIRNDTNRLIVYNNVGPVSTYNQNGVSFNYNYYMYIWGNVKFILIELTNITTPASVQTVTLQYNAIFNNYEVSARAHTSTSSQIIDQLSIVRFNNRIQFNFATNVSNGRGVIAVFGI